MPASTLSAGTDFRRRLTVVLLVPFVLMSVIAGVLGLLVLRLANLSRAAADSERVIAELNHLERLLIDSETGMRGFLQFGADDFLWPMTAARDQIPASMAILDRESLDDEQRARLRAVRDGYARWSHLSVAAIAQRRADDASYQSIDAARERKTLMDQLRAEITVARNREGVRRGERADAAVAATRWTIVASVALVIAMGVTVGTFARRELTQLAAAFQSNVSALEGQASELRTLTATLEQRVAERTGELQQLNRELEAFSYSVSHDLRAPLRHISGFSQLLGEALKDTPDPRIAHYVHRIVQRTHEAGELIDDLLAFSRTGRAPLHKQRVDTMTLVRGVVKALAADAPDRAIDWHIEPLPEVDADPALLRIVFANMLGNAFKYTRMRSPAAVTVAASVEPQRVVFRVSDNGVGFDMQYSDKLFGVFQRLHTADEFEGTGIGLATVRRIVMRHGGETWAEGRVDQGATFFFALPRTA